MRISPQALYNFYRTILRNPKYRWWIILGTFVYLLSPLDLAPDLFPLVGQIDDVVLLTLLFSEFYQMFGEYIQSLRSQPAENNPPTQVNQDDPPSQTTIDVEAETIDEN